MFRWWTCAAWNNSCGRGFKLGPLSINQWGWGDLAVLEIHWMNKIRKAFELWA